MFRTKHRMFCYHPVLVSISHFLIVVNLLEIFDITSFQVIVHVASKMNSFVYAYSAFSSKSKDYLDNTYSPINEFKHSIWYNNCV